MLILISLFNLIVSSPITSQTISAKSFVDSFGVNVHMEYTDGKYSNVQNVLADLKYLGITHVRDGVPQSSWMPAGQGVAAINTLAATGIQFVICVSNTDLQTDLEQLTALQSKNPGMLSAVEGPNEINNWPISYQGAKGQTAAVKFQTNLYKAVHGNPLFVGVPVYYFTGGSPVTLKRGNRLADAANEHPYPQNGRQPTEIFDQAFASDYPLSTVSKVVTETGYYTLPASRVWGGVDEVTQAKGALALYFEAARRKISATYLYQLLDAYPDPSGKTNDHHFGLFNYDNSPKAAATAVHNVTRFLADDISLVQALPYKIDGLPATGRSVLLSKSDGTFVIAVWNSVPFWDESKLQPIHSAPVAASLVLTRPADVKRLDPLSNSVESLKAGTRFEIQIPDYPVLLSVTKTN
jgi:hypothetical protein